MFFFFFLPANIIQITGLTTLAFTSDREKISSYKLVVKRMFSHVRVCRPFIVHVKVLIVTTCP